MAWARSAAVYNYIGIGVEARRRCEQALGLSPFDRHAFWTHCQLAITAYTMTDYETAIAWGSRAYAENPNFIATLRFLAASTAAVGRTEDARIVADRLIRLEPGFALGNWRKVMRFRMKPAKRSLQSISSLPTFRNSPLPGATC
jgi:adenylate cyclase